VNINNLGQKIKKYRTRAGLSQLDLENEIDASSGSISRMENDIVNPTKETLGKLAEAMGLSSMETADLLGLTIFSTESLINALNDVAGALDIQSILQIGVDILYDIFPMYNGGVIFLIDKKDDDRLYSKTVSKMPGIRKAMKILPNKFSKLNVSLSKHKENYCVRSIVEGVPMQSFELIDFTVGTIGKKASFAISRILSFKSGIAIPLKTDEKSIGVVLYTKRIAEIFSAEEVRLLTLLNKQFALLIQKF